MNPGTVMEYGTHEDSKTLPINLMQFCMIYLRSKFSALLLNRMKLDFEMMKIMFDFNYFSHNFIKLSIYGMESS